MDAPTPVEKIRAVINRFPAWMMWLDPGDKRRALAFGGTWSTPGKKAYLYLSHAKILLLRDAPPHVPQRMPWLHYGVARFDGVFINFCIWRWIEEIPHPKPLLARNGMSQSTALQLHLAIEQINYADIQRPAVTGLSDGDMDRIADFIRFPLQQYLKKWVADERRYQEKFGGHAIPVVGKLHENWRRPRPLLVELHEHVAGYAASFSLERINDPVLERYQVDEEDRRKVFRVDGEPDVLIFLPEWGREYPDFYPGTVRIGSMEIPIEVESLSFSRLAEPITERSGKSIKRLSFYMMIHPFSLRVEPQNRLPAGLDMATATKAVEHMKNTWLKDLNSGLQDTPERADVVII